MKRRRISIIILIIMLVTLFPSSSLNAHATTALDNKKVYRINDYESGDCVLSSNVCMMRRAMIIDGSESWSSITNDDARKYICYDTDGHHNDMYFSYTYTKGGYTFKGSSGNLPNTYSGNKEKLISLLEKHPEGIVVYGYNSAGPHGVLITGYKNGEFYCADSTYNYGAYNYGIVKFSESTMTSLGACHRYWYLSSIKSSEKTYKLRYSDGDSSTSYDEDAKIIPSQTIKSGVSTKTSSKRFTKSGYHYDNWYIFRFVDGKAHYWCRNKTTGGSAGWYAYDAIPSTHKKVAFPHGGSIYFTVTKSDIVMYLTPAWEKNTYTLRYSDGLSSSSYDADEKIIPRQVIESGVSTKTTDIKFTRTGYYYDNWYIFKLVDGKAHYWCRNKTTGGDGRWYAYDAIPSTHKKVSFAHGGSIYFILNHGSTIYLTPAWKTSIDLEDICSGSDEILLSETVYTYDGKAKKPSVTVPGLTIGEDYTVSYANNVNPGKATVTIRGIGTYTGIVTKTFTITSKKSGWQEIDGTWYYFKNGVTVKGWLKTGGMWYYFDGKGMMQTGLKTISGEKYYFKSSGAMKTGWQEINSTWYYFKSSGAAAEGWQKVSNKWYYLNEENEMLTGLQEIKNEEYYFDGSGAMKTGWKQIDGVWYYFKSSGAAAEGWQKISNKWYYFDEDSEMLIGLQEIKNEKYYFDGSGAMKTGWKQIDDTWYYFTSSGAAAEGWQKMKNIWYYFDMDNEMMVGFVAIDGAVHQFSNDGAWLGKLY